MTMTTIKPAARSSAFYWRDFVQPHKVVPRRTELRNVLTESWDIVPSSPDPVISTEARVTHAARPARSRSK
jgi:hypothetical protein